MPAGVMEDVAVSKDNKVMNHGRDTSSLLTSSLLVIELIFPW